MRGKKLKNGFFAALALKRETIQPSFSFIMLTQTLGREAKTLADRLHKTRDSRVRRLCVGHSWPLFESSLLQYVNILGESFKILCKMDTSIEKFTG